MAATDKHIETFFTKGSTYRIRSLGTKEQLIESQGEFLGFTPIGMSGEAIVLLLDGSGGATKGGKRAVPVHMILSVDVLKEATTPERKEEAEAAHTYYT